ncbi:hypothetical protein KB559_03415 [Paenibacillus sp. Marseille-P2973]|nr:hypothetical protein [Paenibacillus sp. Marseille-P2973]
MTNSDRSCILSNNKLILLKCLDQGPIVQQSR